MLREVTRHWEMTCTREIGDVVLALLRDVVSAGTDTQGNIDKIRQLLIALPVSAGASPVLRELAEFFYGPDSPWARGNANDRVGLVRRLASLVCGTALDQEVAEILGTRLAFLPSTTATTSQQTLSSNLAQPTSGGLVLSGLAASGIRSSTFPSANIQSTPAPPAQVTLSTPIPNTAPNAGSPEKDARGGYVETVAVIYNSLSGLDLTPSDTTLPTITSPQNNAASEAVIDFFSRALSESFSLAKGSAKTFTVPAQGGYVEIYPRDSDSVVFVLKPTWKVNLYQTARSLLVYQETSPAQVSQQGTSPLISYIPLAPPGSTIRYYHGTRSEAALVPCPGGRVLPAAGLGMVCSEVKLSVGERTVTGSIVRYAGETR